MSKELKYRAICPRCNKAFDSREGKVHAGELVCPECHSKIPFKTWYGYDTGSFSSY